MFSQVSYQVTAAHPAHESAEAQRPAPGSLEDPLAEAQSDFLASEAESPAARSADRLSGSVWAFDYGPCWFNAQLTCWCQKSVPVMLAKGAP